MILQAQCTFRNLNVLISLSLVLVAFIFLLINTVIPSIGVMTHGFIGYYTASVLLLQGKLGPQAYQNEWFSQQVQSIINQPISEILAPSLPTMSLIAIPFTVLPPQPARDSWIWFNLLVLCMALGVLIFTYFHLNLSDIHLSAWLIFIAFALVFPPVAANFYVGQAIILFLCLFTLTLFGLVSGRDWLVGLTLGLAFILKTTGVFLWLLLLIYRRWKALAWGIGTAVVIAVLSLPWVGLDTWLTYLQAVWRLSNSPIAAVTAYQTTHGFFTHLLRFDSVWNPYPVYNWPALARLLTLFITITAIGLTIWLGQKPSLLTELFAALIILSVVLLPVGEEHHFVLLLIPIFILINNMLDNLSTRQISRLDWTLLGIALFLLMAPIPYKQPTLGVGGLALFAYPRLFGAWLIWFIIIHHMLVKQRISK